MPGLRHCFITFFKMRADSNEGHWGRQAGKLDGKKGLVFEQKGMVFLVFQSVFLTLTLTAASNPKRYE
jgi:hypothetical protein